MGKAMEGIVCPVITPIKDGVVDGRDVDALVNFLEKSGVDGIFPSGSTGAFPLMDKSMHMSIIEAFRERVGKRMLFLPGTGRGSTSETAEVSKRALRLGADAVVVVTPYYMKVSQESMLKYFDSIAEEIGGPMILYNIPQLTGNALGVETIGSLAESHENIVGIKDSSMDFGFFSEIVNRFSDRLAIFQGMDNLLLPSLLLGAAGGVCGTTNFTGLAKKVHRTYKLGRMEKARKMQSLLTEIMSIAGSLPFPSNYNYLFYKRVMGRECTCAVPPLEDIGKMEGMEAYGRLKTLLGKT